MPTPPPSAASFGPFMHRIYPCRSHLLHPPLLLLTRLFPRTAAPCLRCRLLRCTASKERKIGRGQEESKRNQRGGRPEDAKRGCGNDELRQGSPPPPISLTLSFRSRSSGLRRQITIAHPRPRLPSSLRAVVTMFCCQTISPQGLAADPPRSPPTFCK
uniref:Uncharacterized protein n=1 Tax=Leersia perrieri TaxID=77586 RepID=A0A0D9XRG1_9ORYZ